MLASFFASFEGTDWQERVAAHLHPDVVWHVTGENPLAGVFAGVDAVIEAMKRFGAHAGGSLRLSTRSVLADDEHAVAIHHAKAKSGDVRYEAHEIDVFHVSDGLIREFWSFSEDQRATDRIWS